MKNEVIEIISKVTEIPVKKINLDSNLVKDLKAPTFYAHILCFSLKREKCKPKIL